MNGAVFMLETAETESDMTATSLEKGAPARSRARLVLFRFVLRRQTGTLAPSDFMLVLLISEAAQNGMGEGIRSVTDSLVLIGTLAAWDYAIDWLAARHRGLRRFLKPVPLLLIDEGRLQIANLRKELLTKDELAGA